MRFWTGLGPASATIHQEHHECAQSLFADWLCQHYSIKFHALTDTDRQAELPTCDLKVRGLEAVKCRQPPRPAGANVVIPTLSLSLSLQSNDNNHNSLTCPGCPYPLPHSATLFFCHGPPKSSFDSCKANGTNLGIYGWQHDTAYATHEACS